MASDMIHDSEAEHRRVHIEAQKQHKSYRLLGLSFWQTWWMVAMCTSIVIPSGGASLQFPVGTATIWVLILTTVGYAVIVGLSKRFSPFGFKNRNLVIAGVTASVGSVGIPLALTNLYGPLCFAVFFLSLLLVSLGNALLLMMWGELWGELATGRVGYHLYLSYTFAFVLFIIIWFLPKDLAMVVVALLPVASVLILASCKDEPKRARSALLLDSRTIPAIRIVIAVLLISIVHGASQGLAASFAPNLPADEYLFYVMLFAGACIGLITLSMVLMPSSHEAEVLYRPVIPSVVAGLLMLLMLPASFSFIGDGLIILGIYCLDMLMMLVSTDVAFRTHLPIAFTFGLVILTARTGTLVGSLIVHGAQASPLWDMAMRNEMILAGVLVVALVGMLLFTQADLRKLFATTPSLPEGDPFDEKCLLVAEAYGLTPREHEVLRLLARGRSIPFICDELVIAQGTAKHHVSNIYRKIGIGDRQGLHDIIEQTPAL
jgi:DNA-binding CsgD family transcriptional regulator